MRRLCLVCLAVVGTQLFVYGEDDTLVPIDSRLEIISIELLPGMSESDNRRAATGTVPCSSDWNDRIVAEVDVLDFGRVMELEVIYTNNTACDWEGYTSVVHSYDVGYETFGQLITGPSKRVIRAGDFFGFAITMIKPRQPGKHVFHAAATSVYSKGHAALWVN